MHLVPALVTIVTETLVVTVTLVTSLLPQLADSVHIPRVLGLTDGILAALFVSLTHLGAVNA